MQTDTYSGDLWAPGPFGLIGPGFWSISADLGKWGGAFEPIGRVSFLKMHSRLQHDPRPRQGCSSEQHICDRSNILTVQQAIISKTSTYANEPIPCGLNVCRQINWAALLKICVDLKSGVLSKM